MHSLLLAAALWAASATEPAGIPAVDTLELAEKLKSDFNLLIIDLRSPEEFADGHLPFAVNVPWGAPKAQTKLEALLKGGPRSVILYGADALTLGTVAQHSSTWNGAPVALYPAGVQGWGEYAGGFLEIEWPGVWRLLTKGTPVLFDVRESAEYAAGHIPGARHIEPTLVGQRAVFKAIGKVEKGEIIVTYCGGELCGESRRLAEHLSKAGYKRVFQFPGGYPEFSEKTAPLER